MDRREEAWIRGLKFATDRQMNGQTDALYDKPMHGLTSG
ncbi:hypothetical protein JOC55_003535 [Paenibacillus sacheonensis]|nr:hypothetical protein [Paenibacillus sacheonensis]